jgi:trimeric autotransporter adhesin
MPIKRILFLLFIVTTFFAEVGHAQLTLLPLTNTTKRTIVVMGSSSAAGWKSSVPDSAWVARLQTDLNFYGRGDVIVNLAVPGFTTYDVLPTGTVNPSFADPPQTSNNITAALTYNPTFVIISLPTNDIVNDYDLNTNVMPNFTTITNILNAKHIPYIITGSQPRDLATDAGCSIAYDGAGTVCLSTGNMTPTKQANLLTFNSDLATQYPASSTPYSTPVVNNFFNLLNTTGTEEINPTISYGDGIHYKDNGHRIVYDTMVNFQYYKDLVCFTQTITMGPLTSTVGAADFTPGSVSSTGAVSSGLALTYTSSNSAVATIVAGKIHIVGAGTANITANQAGNQHYLAASPVTVLLTVTSTGPPAVTYDWLGTASTGLKTDWTNQKNWKSTVGAVVTNPAAGYPGQTLSTDIVNIGVNVTFINNPIISAAIPNAVASLTFGDKLITGATTATDSLTINSGFTLTVTGQLLQKHTKAGVTNAGNTALAKAITTYIKGGGIINCGSVAVGDNTTPTNNGAANLTKLELGSPAQGTTLTMNVTGNLTLNTQSKDNGTGTQILSTNDAQFSLAAGTLNMLTGQIQLTDGGVATTAATGNFKPASTFSIDLYKTSDSPVLNLQNANALISTVGATTFNKIDFFNIVTTGGAGVATVNYTGAAQEVYNFISGSTAVNGVIDNSGFNPGDGSAYENVGFGGSGTKTVDGAATTPILNVAHLFTLAAGAETVDLSASNSALEIGWDFTTGAGSTFTCGTGLFFLGGSFFNSGTCNFGTAAVTFNSGGGEFMTTVNPQLLTNITISGDGDEYITGGSFVVASKGVLTLSGTTTTLHVNTGSLTLNSDSTASATIAAIPTGCSIMGNVNVQRYITGGLDEFGVTYRGYRLLSSPVYTATDPITGHNNNKLYSINYLLNSTYLTGTTFPTTATSKPGNPTLYLYRESLIPQFTTFLNSNFRGINNISSAPTYTIDIDGPNYNIPIGNGYLFFFRGVVGTVNPFTTTAVPHSGTVTSTGILNQGTINVVHWFTPGSPTLSFTTSEAGESFQGLNLVGNPYASSIDWNTFGTTSGSGIQGIDVNNFTYMLVPGGEAGSGNYAVYNGTIIDMMGDRLGGTNGGNNIIPSGAGFFVQAGGTDARLIFSEAAKVNTQVTGQQLFLSKRFPTTINTIQTMRLKMALDTINSDETIIAFNNQSKTTFVPAEDARYKVGSGKVSLSSLSSDNVQIAINQMPLALKGDTIKLQVGATASGTYTLKMGAIKGIPAIYAIRLKDAFTKDSVNMRTTPNYSFTVNIGDTTTFGANRFKLLIVQDPAYAYKLLTFGAGKIPQQMQVALNWTTQNEGNTTNFTVERSNDKGRTFNAIGGFISSGTGTYNLIDKAPEYGDNQYRLRQQDINYNITYSPTVDVQIVNQATRMVSVYPNPASGIINLYIDTKSADAGTFNIRISNSSGVLVKNAVSLTPNWQDNVSELLTGTYLIQVVNNKDNSLVGEAKFVKL